MKLQFNSIKHHLGNILAWLRDRIANQTDCAAVNLLNLSSHLKTDIRGFDFSEDLRRGRQKPGFLRKHCVVTC